MSSKPPLQGRVRTMQWCNNVIDIRLHRKTSMAAAKGKTAMEFDSIKYNTTILSLSGMNQRIFRLVEYCVQGKIFEIAKCTLQLRSFQHTDHQ